MNKRQQTVRISIQWTGCGNTGKKKQWIQIVIKAIWPEEVVFLEVNKTYIRTEFQRPWIFSKSPNAILTLISEPKGEF